MDHEVPDWTDDFDFSIDRDTLHRMHREMRRFRKDPSIVRVEKSLRNDFDDRMSRATSRFERRQRRWSN